MLVFLFCFLFVPCFFSLYFLFFLLCFISWKEQHQKNELLLIFLNWGFPVLFFLSNSFSYLCFFLVLSYVFVQHQCFRFQKIKVGKHQFWVKGGLQQTFFYEPVFCKMWKVIVRPNLPPTFWPNKSKFPQFYNQKWTRRNGLQNVPNMHFLLSFILLRFQPKKAKCVVSARKSRQQIGLKAYIYI